MYALYFLWSVVFILQGVTVKQSAVPIWRTPIRSNTSTGFVKNQLGKLDYLRTSTNYIPELYFL